MFILKSLIALLSVVSMILSASPLHIALPYLDVIPDMMEVGIEYIDLDFNMGAVTKKELKKALAEAEDVHPFVLAKKENFDYARDEYNSGNFTEYTKALSNGVIANAEGLLDYVVLMLSFVYIDYQVSQYLLDFGQIRKMNKVIVFKYLKGSYVGEEKQRRTQLRLRCKGEI